MGEKRNIEVCFSPAIYNRYHNPEAIVVVVDILRASSAIAAAFANGVQKIIPVAGVEEARALKAQGYLIAAERDGLALDFADYSNNPYDFMTEQVRGKTIVFSTTNGTQAIGMASRSHAVVLGSFINHTSVKTWLIRQDRDIVILCAGWKDRFSLEDTVYAGALAKDLMDSGKYATICDGAIAAMDLWELASNDIFAYKDRFEHLHRLKRLKLDDCVDFCLTFDTNNAVPVFQAGAIVNANL